MWWVWVLAWVSGRWVGGLGGCGVWWGGSAAVAKDVELPGCWNVWCPETNFPH